MEKSIQKGQSGKPRLRDAEATQKRILAAAKRVFAQLGLGGARVDDIAEKAKANKRMIYHYFESKDHLFQTVLEHAYLDIRTAEAEAGPRGISLPWRRWKSSCASRGNTIWTTRNF